MKIEDELKQGKFQSNVHKALVNLMFTNSWISDRFRVVFKNYQLTSQQYNVLRILRGGYPEAMNPNQIKAVMIDKNPDLTRLCDRLLAMGYIERCVNDANKRKMNIRINEKGLEILEQINPAVSKVQSEISGLTEAEAAKLSNLLDKVRNV